MRISKMVLVMVGALAPACADDVPNLGSAGSGTSGTSAPTTMAPGTTTTGTSATTGSTSDPGNVDTTAAVTVGPPDGTTTRPSDSSGPGPTATTAPSGTSEGPPDDGDCCEAHVAPGCEVASIEGCVCMLDSYCCEGQWDQSCAEVAVNLCGAECPTGESTGGSSTGASGGSDTTAGSGGSTGDCCAIHASSGCEDPVCEAAVCGPDPFCCAGEWDALCVDRAMMECPGLCGGATGGSTGGTTGDGGGDCCVNNGTPGCEDPTCQASVCGVDMFCCDMVWDQLCAEHAEAECPGLCGVPTGGTTSGGTTDGGGGDCCAGNGTPGCDDPGCEAAVCAVDMYCCDMEWDFMCADQALLECGGLCVGGSGTGSGSGSGGGTGNDCCIDNGTPGCEDPVCEAVVCSMDAYCCTMEWDGLCADQALVHCPFECGGGSSGSSGSDGGGGTGGPDSDCCTESPTGLPGCIDATCEVLVCALDAHCCNVAWDGLCATQAINECPLCGGGAGSGGGSGDCCSDNGTPGCEDPGCEAPVCAADPSCCNAAWDGLCADLAMVHCPALCP